MGHERGARSIERAGDGQGDMGVRVDGCEGDASMTLAALALGVVEAEPVG